MSIDLNDEILQDFLVEAGEIVELLDEQLVELEQNPDDRELLNAIFRGFHTIKGGAGFLGIDELVVICHRAEDVFNLLRQGDLKVDQNLMDVVLKVHDKLRVMFSSITDGVNPEAADSGLISSLEQFCQNYSNGSAAVPGEISLAGDDNATLSDKEAAVTGNSGEPVEAVSNEDNITDEEFENLLDQLHGSGTPKVPEIEINTSSSDDTSRPGDITDEEFENILDEIHGSGIPGNSGANQPVSDSVVADVSIKPKAVSETEVSRLAEKTTVPTRSNAKTIEKEADKAGSQQDTTVRVDTSRLDDIMNLVGELVLVRNRLATLESTVVNEDMSVAVSNLDLVTSDLQTAVMKTRMQPIKKVFGRFPRVVRDLSRSLNKDVELLMIGEDTDLDKNLVEALADPLVHLVRNSVDHGIEMPDVREKSGKTRRGTITLSAQQEGENILLAITDDGAGMDSEVLKRIAINKGVIDEDTAGRLTPDECYSLIFMPGFSTKDEISDISGRGVGMDVVKTKITQLNGSINIYSELGKGSRIEIKVPLTLAIMPTVMVMIAGQVYALPLTSVVEIFNFDKSMTKMVDKQEVVLIRDKPLPIFHLNKWLSKNGTDVIGKRLVVVNAAGKEFGFVVESLLGQEEVVIKPLGTLLQGTKGMSGATITGDGKISLILDVPGLMHNYASGI